MLTDILMGLLLGATIYVTSGVESQARRAHNMAPNSQIVVNARPVSSTLPSPKQKGYRENHTSKEKSKGRKVWHLLPHRVNASDNIRPTRRQLSLLRRLTSRNISCAFVYLKTIDENGTQYYDPEQHFQDVRIEVVNQYDGPETSTSKEENAYVYDQTGAMYFAVAVITIYGLSIALLIASSMRRSDEDYELKGFIRSFAQLEQARVKKPKDKYKITRALLESGVLFRVTAQALPRKVLPKLIGCRAPVAPSTSELPMAPSSENTPSGTCSTDFRLDCDGLRVGNIDRLCAIPEENGNSDEGNPKEFLSGANSFPSGPRHVKIYQGKERGKIDVRSSDIALDIPEDSTI